MSEKSKYGVIYFPENRGEPKAIDGHLEFKFSQSAFLLKSALDQMGIEYTDEDLESTPYGLAWRLRNADGSPDGRALKSKKVEE